MLVLNPQTLMDDIQNRVTGAVEGFFPFVGEKQTLRLKSIYVSDPKSVDDIAGQAQAKRLGRTWSVGVFGDLELVDNKTGSVIDRHAKAKLLSIPALTRRYSFIVKGPEYQVSHLWRLKSGVYTKIARTGEPETQFNLAKGFNRVGFSLVVDPKNKGVLLQYRTTNVPLYSVLKVLGTSDADIEKAWGPQILKVGVEAGRPLADAKRLLVSLGDEVETEEAVVTRLKERFAETELRPDTTQLTLGEKFTSVDSRALLAASNKLLRVFRGEIPPDNRDEIPFKDLLHVDDLLVDRLDRSERTIKRKVRNNLDRKSTISEIISSDIFGAPIASFFTSTSIASQTPQTNPITMVSNHVETTLLGEDVGGIADAFRVTTESKMADKTQLGILDPMHTPEGERSGITLKLALGVKKVGKDVYAWMYNTRTNKMEHVSPADLSRANVAFPDQYTNVDGKYTPLTQKVTVQSPDSIKKTVDPSQVDYIIPHPTLMFSPVVNLVPFLQNDEGTRVEMAVRHIEQALPLKYREQPLVQVQASPKDSGPSFEKAWAAFAAHSAPVAGLVVAVDKKEIILRTKTGKEVKVGLYDNFPLNEEQAYLHSEPLVKVGDRVESGQIIADSNFTRDGVLALGKNLLVAYLPYKGLVYEDGLILSETGAKKLTSVHLHKPSLYMDREHFLDKKKFRMLFPSKLTATNAEKLDDSGIIKVGQTVEPGDVLVATAKKAQMTPERMVLHGIHKSLVSNFADKSLVWSSSYPGEVVDVIRRGKEVEVLVRTEEPAKAADKISARHGNKGVVSYVFPDDEMPYDAEGRVVDIIMNPQGVPGRMNPGQVAETSLSRVAEAEGSPIAVRNFEPEAHRRLVKVKGHWRTVRIGPERKDTKEIWIEPFEYERDYLDSVREKLEEHNLKQGTELFDPETKESFGNVLVGKQYILKLVHQAEKKFAARAWGPGYEYSVDMEPRGGGKHGAQRIGELGLYALLAHGAVENIREFSSYKSDASQSEIWTAVQLGMPLPKPQVPFAFDKFVGYLNALGLDVERRDDTLVVMPFTDAEVDKASAGELSRPGRMLRAKDLRPEAGGLFDPELTGGVGGTKFSHFRLPERFPSPVFERAIRSLLGIRQKDLDGLISGTVGLKDGQLVPAEGATVLGPTAVSELLRRIDVDAELERSEAMSKTAKSSTLDALNRKIKYLRALKRLGISAAEAYTTDKILVLPPRFRPITVLDDGNLNRGDLNQLYRELALSAEQLATLPPEALEDQRSALRQEVYNGLKALQGLIGPARKHKGILDIIAGKTPKEGYFTTRLIKRKQDLSARSVIVPNQDLQLDEIGVPERLAMEIFRPFVMQRLVLNGRKPLEAREAILNKLPEARIALKHVLAERPVLMKRDPVLHKYGVMAFNVRLMGDREVGIHPLMCDAYNADFDGDAVSLHVPVSKKAVAEAYRLLPSNNLLTPATGLPAFMPTKESVVGTYLLTRVRAKSPQTKFAQSETLIAAAKAKEIPWDTLVTMGNKQTTAGREFVRQSLPEETHSFLPSEGDWSLNKKGLTEFLKPLAIKNPHIYPRAVQVLKDLGFEHMHRIGFSFDLDTFRPFSKLRIAEMKAVQPEYEKILGSTASQEDKDAKIVKLYTDVGDRLLKKVRTLTEAADNPLAVMANAGVKPSWSQIKQILISPLLVEDSTGRIVPSPISSSYGEGMSLHDYWTGAAGVRKGITFKVQEVQIPGALTKQMVKSTAGITVTESDCRTPAGVFFPANEISILDRFLSAPVKLKGSTLDRGTLVTPDVLSKLKLNKISRVPVRSPLRCAAKKGICQACYGVDSDGSPVPKGSNVGIIASQSLGERGVQLAMRVFHLGGVAGSGGGLIGAMDRLSQVLKMPAKIPGAATLAKASGKVTSVARNPAGGTDVTVGGIVHNVPALRKLSVVAGAVVSRGDPISSGPISPQELLELTNLPTVQNYLVGELGKLYDKEGIKRRHSEVLVKALTSLSKVEDAGGNEEFLRGDTIPTSMLSDWNDSKNRVGEPIKYAPILRGIGTLPFHLYPDWLTQMNYQGLRDVLVRAASEQSISHLHGEHPIPGVVYGKEFGQSDTSTY